MQNSHPQCNIFRMALVSCIMFFIINNCHADYLTDLPENTKQLKNAKIIGDVDKHQLIINGKQIKTNLPNGAMNLLNIAQVGDKTIYFVEGDLQGSGFSDECAFVTVNPNKSVAVSQSIFGCGKLSLLDNKILIKGVNTRVYADNNDIAIMLFDPISNNITTISNPKPASYYKQRFSSYTVNRIISEAVSDSCYDNTEGLNTSHACNYGEKYCFMLNSIKKPTKDNNYKNLKEACKDFKF